MKKISSIFLAILLLLTNLGVGMGTHYCGGKAVKSQLMMGFHSIDCGMKSMDTSCNPAPRDNHDHRFQKKPCCENKFVEMDAEDATTNKVVVNSLTLDFLVTFSYTFLSFDPFISDGDTRYLSYTPPILKQDLPVLFESFLI